MDTPTGRRPADPEPSYASLLLDQMGMAVIATDTDHGSRGFLEQFDQVVDAFAAGTGAPVTAGRTGTRPEVRTLGEVGGVRVPHPGERGDPPATSSGSIPP